MAIAWRYFPMGYIEPLVYPIGTVLLEVRGGNTWIDYTLPRGYFFIELVGGGGGQGGWANAGGYSWGGGGGGSGARLTFYMWNPEPRLYNYYSGNKGNASTGYVGTGSAGGNSAFRPSGQPWYAQAGGGNQTTTAYWDRNGSAGTVTTTNLNAANLIYGIVSQNGNPGTGAGMNLWNAAGGGVSVYGGFGNGGKAGSETAGLVRITYMNNFNPN